MNTITSYLGLKLKNPIIVGSSTFTGTADGIKRCAEAGAGAVVLKSIFEEQIFADIKKEEGYTDLYMSNPDADVYMKTFLRGNEISIYEKLIREAKETVDIPIIASINCADKGEWISFAKEFENAGADALELNIAVSPFNREIPSKDIEDEVIAIFSEVKKNVKIPVSVKLGNHFTNIGNLAFRLSMAGAAGLVLFNRYYNPTIDIEKMKVVPGTALSVEEENGDTLRWIKILSSEGIPCELSASTGVHTSEDVVRQLLAGAATVQVCSTLYKNGVSYISEIIAGLEAWMRKHNFNSINDFKGKCSAPEDIKIFERLQYLRRNNDLNL
ncbi:MAG: dihydroorotate dehydrogenase-like protein [Bacteroidales bacterium]|nr:dihydroorotate dehydrogenase-like protein [Bacteroidales bacterium]